MVSNDLPQLLNKKIVAQNMQLRYLFMWGIWLKTMQRQLFLKIQHLFMWEINSVLMFNRVCGQ